MKATAINDVLVALVTAFGTALDCPVFDGPPTRKPGRDVDAWVVIGAEEPDNQPNEQDTQQASMQAQIIGLGGMARDEELSIECVVVGRAIGGSIADARQTASDVLEDVSENLPHWPSADSYAPQVSAVTGVRVRNVSGGAIAQIHFTISARARLT